MKETIRRTMKILLVLLVLFVLSALISAVVCSRWLKHTDYTAELKNISAPFRAVLISDLHGREYGEDNAELLSLIAQQEPDVIFADGDMISRDADSEQVQSFLELLCELKKLAPVFYSTGNHEIDYMKQNGETLLADIAATGATVLYDSFVETEIAGNTVRIGGTSGHYRESNREEELDYAMQEAIGSTDIPAIVLMHMPENLLLDSAREKWAADLYLSGHTHGGVVRLPLIGGLVAPTQGLFPRYDAGEYLIDGRLRLIITSGLAGYEFIPRVFNRPEICVIDFAPEG